MYRSNTQWIAESMGISMLSKIYSNSYLSWQTESIIPIDIIVG